MPCPTDSTTKSSKALRGMQEIPPLRAINWTPGSLGSAANVGDKAGRLTIDATRPSPARSRWRGAAASVVRLGDRRPKLDAPTPSYGLGHDPFSLPRWLAQAPASVSAITIRTGKRSLASGVLSGFAIEPWYYDRCARRPLVLGRNRLLPPRRPSGHAGGAARSRSCLAGNEERWAKTRGSAW
jgi:hypothetical protein